MPEIEVQIEENYQKWQDEAKIWPKQRAIEYSRIQAYLKNRNSFRHIASVDNSRSSMDSVGSAPPALATVSHHHIQKETSPLATTETSTSVSTETHILETTPESPVALTAPELV
jgi:hypothetical protein